MRRVKKLSEAWYRTNSGCGRSVSNTIVKETEGTPGTHSDTPSGQARLTRTQI